MYYAQYELQFHNDCIMNDLSDYENEFVYQNSFAKYIRHIQ